MVMRSGAGEGPASIRPLDRPYSPTGGLAVLFGNRILQ